MLIKIKSLPLFLFVFTFLVTSNIISAHCDSMEGPVVKASRKALETGNVNYVLVWVKTEDEKEIKNLFYKVLAWEKLVEKQKN